MTLRDELKAMEGRLGDRMAALARSEGHTPALPRKIAPAPAELDREVQRLWRAGMSQAEIGRTLGRGESWVLRSLRRTGEKPNA